MLHFSDQVLGPPCHAADYTCEESYLDFFIILIPQFITIFAG